MKKLLSIFLIFVLLFGVVACNAGTSAEVTVVLPDESNSSACEHEWSEANCTTPKTCRLCKETKGTVLAHDFADATCTAPKTCKVCGVTEGAALGHDWADADCDTPKTCKVCGATEGEALGHDWADADCDTPKTCKVCGVTEGEALGHEWADADCDTPKTCTVCGATEGNPTGHTEEVLFGKKATCTENGLTDGKNCSVCGKTLVAQETILASGHAYGNWVTVTPSTSTTPGLKKKTCSRCGDEITEEIPKKESITYQLNDSTEGIKILGERHATGTAFIAMDWSCSGIEFNAKIHSTSSISFTAAASGYCYFAVYVDGVLYKNGSSDYFTVNTQTTTITLSNISAGDHTIRLIKVTGYTIATAQVYTVSFTDGRIDPNAPAKNDLYIEFLGDSISCGWGVIGNHDGGYASQDGTKAYPYRVAQRLGADYSITALSGRGVIYGSDLNFDKNYLHASPSRSQEEYSFARQADIVVINLGTNDRGHNANVNDFEDAYVRLLDNIFKKNGEDCVVYCLWGVMNDAYSTYIQAAIARYQEDHPNAQIHTLPLPKATFTEAGGHPSEGDNTKYMLMLEAKIKATYPGFEN